MVKGQQYNVQVKVEGDDVIVKADKKSLANTHRTPIPCPAAPEKDGRVFVLVGGGEWFIR